MSSNRRREDGEPIQGSPSFARVLRGSASLPDAPLAWPIPVAGFLAAASTAVLTLLTLAFVFSFGWIATSDPNSEYISSLQAAVAMWLLAHGVPVAAGGLEFSLIPLLVTFLFLRFHVNAFKKALGSAIIVNAAGVLGLIASYVVSYAGFGLIATLLTGSDIFANASRAMLGTSMTAIVGAVWAVARSQGHIVATEKRTFSQSSERTQTRIKARSAHELVTESWALLPLWVRDSFAVGIQSTVFVIVGSAIATLVLIGFQLSEIISVIEMTATSSSSLIVVTLLSLTFLPTVVGWVFAIISGPGIALGAGSSFTLLSQASGAMPAVAFFAVIPTQLPTYVATIGALPVLGTFVGTQRWFKSGRVQPQRIFGWFPHILLTAIVSAVISGLIGYAVSGSFGGGRFTAIGPSIALLMLFSAGWSALGSCLRVGFHQFYLSHKREAK